MFINTSKEAVDDKLIYSGEYKGRKIFIKDVMQNGEFKVMETFPETFEEYKNHDYKTKILKYSKYKCIYFELKKSDILYPNNADNDAKLMFDEEITAVGKLNLDSNDLGFYAGFDTLEAYKVEWNTDKCVEICHKIIDELDDPFFIHSSIPLLTKTKDHFDNYVAYDGIYKGRRILIKQGCLEKHLYYRCGYIELKPTDSVYPKDLFNFSSADADAIANKWGNGYINFVGTIQIDGKVIRSVFIGFDSVHFDDEMLNMTLDDIVSYCHKIVDEHLS